MNTNCSLCQNEAEVPVQSIIQDAYSDIFGCELSSGMRLCYICMHMLRKLFEFKKRCLRAQSCLHASKENPVHKISTSPITIIDIQEETNASYEICQHLEEQAISNEEYQHSETESVDNDEIQNLNLESNIGEIANSSNDSGTNNEVDLEDKPIFEKISLTLEQQKCELEVRRKDVKYLNAEFKCYCCAQGFNYLESYQSHMVRHEESNGRFSCELCSIRFATQSARCTHVAIHSTKYKCTLCERYVSPSGRRSHQCGDAGDVIICSDCGSVMKTSESLRKHVKRMHGSDVNRCHVCHICHRSYTHLHNLRVHLLKHSCVYTCDECGASCNTPYALKRHRTTHVTPRPCGPYCVDCDVTFVNTKTYNAHLKQSSRHRDTRFGHECMVCSMSFITRRDLRRHVSRRHPMYATQPPPPTRRTTLARQKRFLCDNCGKCYNTRSILERHVKTHDKSLPT